MKSKETYTFTTNQLSLLITAIAVTLFFAGAWMGRDIERKKKENSVSFKTAELVKTKIAKSEERKERLWAELDSAYNKLSKSILADTSLTAETKVRLIGEIYSIQNKIERAKAEITKILANTGLSPLEWDSIKQAVDDSLTITEKKTMVINGVEFPMAKPFTFDKGANQ
jgi:hypothetical protein